MERVGREPNAVRLQPPPRRGADEALRQECCASRDWWDDSLAENPAGFAQCLMLLSRCLGIELKSLREPKSPLRLRDFGLCKYKKREGTTDEELLLSRVIATRAAQLAGAAIGKPYQPVPGASGIRRTILERKRWVGLRGLLDYCWSRGVPVLHVSYFPPSAKRADGFTLRLHGSPVIVLCRNERQPSWLLFILAHELGHIASGHIPEDGALLDERLQENRPDKEEQEADCFALELLTGKGTTRSNVGGRWPNKQQLADLARDYGKRNQVDPGHVVLNYAHTMGPNFFGVARGALSVLYPKTDAMKIVRKKLAENLNWELLPEDSSEFLMRITRHIPEPHE